MTAPEGLSTHDELRRLVAEFADSPSSEADHRIMDEIRALARADRDGFVDALLDLDHASERSDAMESLVCSENYDPDFEPIIDAYADSLDVVLAANPEPASLCAYEAALGYCVLGDLTCARVEIGFADRLHDRAVRWLRHRHPDVRGIAVGLVSDFARAERIGAYEPLRAVALEDPDPVIRAKAHAELASLGLLPPDARPPFKPTWFRALRRYLAGG